MRKICAKQDRDCCVNCTGSGFAFYHRPDGPCRTGCSDSGAASALIKMFQHGGHDGKYEGQMIEIGSKTLSRFAINYGPQAPNQAAIYITRLSSLHDRSPYKKYNIKFNAYSVADAIQQIAIATDDPNGLTLQPVLSSA